jgi:WD40 repeat protein
VQSKGYRSGRKLVACFYDQSRVVILDLETAEQKVVEVKWPWKCAASHQFFSVVAEDGVRLLTLDGDLVHIVPNSKDSTCLTFHPRNSGLLFIGFNDGSVRLWDASEQQYQFELKEHSGQITSITLASDRVIFLSSRDETASITTLASKNQGRSCIKLAGHTSWVDNVLPLLLSNQCVTSSDDKTIKVWDCQTGACLHTLTEHSHIVVQLALHASGQRFASGSWDRCVIIWSTQTFEITHRIQFPGGVQSVAFDEDETLYAGVYNHGVMSCNALTWKIGLVIHGQEESNSVALGICFKNCGFCHPSTCLRHSTCTQALDCFHTCTMVFVCSGHSAHGCSGAVEGARAGTTDACTIRACGARIAPCAVARRLPLLLTTFRFV